MAQPTPVVPAALRADQAIDASDTLRSLLARRQQAQERFNVIRPLVPPDLLARVNIGGVDVDRWSLLVDDASAAAKLRQLVPRFEAALRTQGLAEPPLRIRVIPR